MTQHEFADKINCPRTKLSKIENGKENLTYEQEQNLKENFLDWENYVISEHDEEENDVELKEAKKNIKRLNKLIDLQNEVIDMLKKQLKEK